MENKKPKWQYYFDNWGIEDWEFPECSYCGSNFLRHKQIYFNVQDTCHALVECQNCHLRFYSPRLKFSSLVRVGFGSYEASKKEAQFVYDNASYEVVKDKQKQIECLKSYYKPTMEKLIEIGGVPKSVFEVGGGIGMFGKFFKEKYNIPIYKGCEINKWAVKIANEKFGLEYIAEEFKNYLNSETYDCGVMLDYIEHSYNPYPDLKKIAFMIKKGGTLLLKTFLEDLDLKREMEAPVGHAYHFFGKVLRKMLEDVGFEIIDWKEDWIMITIIGRKK